MGTRKRNLPKKDTVKLVSKGKYKRESIFETQHALSLLRLPNTAWELNDERFIFEDNDIKRQSGKRQNTPTEE